MSDDWRERAACRDQPLELFFPNHVEHGDVYARARTICNQCPVISDCFLDTLRDEAVAYADSLTRYRGGAGGGFRAGLSAAERDRQRSSLHARRKKAQTRTAGRYERKAG